MAKYELVPAQPEHFMRCMEILQSGRAFQRAQGFIQWPDNFPNAERIHKDIADLQGYILLVDDTVAAYLYLGFDGDSNYLEIDGSWLYHEPYAVIHRLALDAQFRGRGLATVIFRLAEQICIRRGCYCLRIDTHQDNKRMQNVLKKNGFSFCGTVMQETGKRMAYEKKLK